jgi:hypothetical protein
LRFRPAQTGPPSARAEQERPAARSADRHQPLLRFSGVVASSVWFGTPAHRAKEQCRSRLPRTAPCRPKQWPSISRGRRCRCRRVRRPTRERTTSISDRCRQARRRAVPQPLRDSSWSRTRSSLSDGVVAAAPRDPIVGAHAFARQARSGSAAVGGSVRASASRVLRRGRHAATRL